MFAQYRGSTVQSISDLRKKLKNAEAELHIPKKTLLKRALEEQKLPFPQDKAFEGPIATIFSYGDPLTGAQITLKFGKEHPEIFLTGGIFEKQTLSSQQAVSFAMIPGRNALLTIFAGMVRSPLLQFAGSLRNPLQSFVRGTAELAKQKKVTM